MATKKSGTKSNNTKTSKRGTASGSTASKKTTKQGTGKSGAGAQKAKRKPTKKAIAKKRSFVIGEVAAIILAFLSVFMFLSNFGLLGGVGEFFAEIQKGLFGMMGYVFPLYLIFTIFYIHFIENDPLFGFKTASVIVLFFIIVALTQFIFGTKEAFSFGEFYELGGAGEFISGAAGGAIGGFITNGIAGALGRVGAFLIIFTLLLITVVVLLEKSFINAVRNGGIFAKESAEKTMGYARERYETQKIARDARREAARLKALEERFEDKPQGSGFDRFDLSRHGRNTAEYEQNVIDDNELPAVNEAAMDATFNDAEAGTNIGTEAVALSQEDGLLAIENRAFAEPDYDIDDVPFDETEEDKYRAYDQMISGNAIGIKTAESLGFAVSHGARVPVTEVSTDEPVMTEEVFNPDEPSLDDELFDATLFDRDYLHKPLNPDEIVYPDIRNASAQGSAGAGVNVNGAANAWNNAGMGAKGGAYDGGNAGFEGDGSYDPYAGSTGNANVGGLDSSDSGEGLDGHDDYNDYNEYNEY
ncbi:MAG: DNA translocase FtsK 4TM domain-containing protein, partial [Eubacteriales bacterium]|nr:DNA translocase FtsK 4TM domain-containing protein [Eubacteriales bacterium]